MIRGRKGFDCGGRNLKRMSRSSGLVKKSTNLYADEALPVAA